VADKTKKRKILQVPKMTPKADWNAT
jgi:hypothetical protein